LFEPAGAGGLEILFIMKQYKILKSKADYNSAIERTIEIFDAEPGQPDFDELEILLLLVKDYEDKHYQIPTPDPIEAIKFKMQEAGLKNKDLIPYIGSEGHVSAILSGKRNLTLEMARVLNTKLGIPPEVFIYGK
jgi:HTH-type transcriptional regulator/antitoxin HigA